MSSWPGTLPQYPLRSGLDEQTQDTTIRTQTEVGPAKVRSVATAAVSTFPMVMNLSVIPGGTDQVQILEDFYNNTLARGSLTFEWKHPRTQATATMRFASRPQYKPDRGTIWRTSFSVEILP